tara:strand:- start:72 stop:755 length:684 start_codon:yes stop_codon:yes gene_type:complete
MKWNNRFNYPRTVRSLEDGIRKYDINNEKLPSVTSVLSATKSQEELASLELWRQRVGAINANKIKKEASTRGSALHAYVEDWLRGRINDSFFESAEQYKSMANQIIKNGIKGRLTEIWGVECNLYYPQKFGGQADIIGIYDNVETIIDLKQANKPKKESFIQDYFLQVAAYSLAHNFVYKTQISQGVILMCTVDNFYQEFKIQNDVLEMYQNLFLGRLKKFYELNSN